jgi:hypothetical protein
MKRLIILASIVALFSIAAHAQCGANGSLSYNPFTKRLDCTGKTGAAGYVATITATTTISVTAATHGQGTKPVGFCYDNATPAVPITLTTNTVAANGDMVFAWSGTKTGYCVISGLGNQIGPTGPTGQLARQVLQAPQVRPDQLGLRVRPDQLERVAQMALTAPMAPRQTGVSTARMPRAALRSTHARHLPLSRLPTPRERSLLSSRRRRTPRRGQPST